MTILRLALFASFLLLVACGSAPCPQGPVTAADARAAAGPGLVDSRIADAAQNARGVDKVKLEMDAEGQIEMIAVYHHESDRVPVTVRQLAEQHFPGAQVRVYELEVHAEGVVHEVEVVTSDGRNCEISVTAGGDLRYEECEMPAEELPGAVSGALNTLLPGAEILEAEKRTAAGSDEFRIEARAAGVVHYVRLDGAGSLVGHQLVLTGEIKVPAP